MPNTPSGSGETDYYGLATPNHNLAWYCGSTEWALQASTFLEQFNAKIIICTDPSVAKILQNYSIEVFVLQKPLDVYPRKSPLLYLETQKKFFQSAEKLLAEQSITKLLINDQTNDVQIQRLAMIASRLGITMMESRTGINQNLLKPSFFSHPIGFTKAAVLASLFHKKIFWVYERLGEYYVHPVKPYPTIKFERIEATPNHVNKLTKITNKIIFVTGGSWREDSRLFDSRALIRLWEVLNRHQGNLIVKQHPGRSNYFEGSPIRPIYSNIDHDAPLESFDLTNCLLLSINSSAFQKASSDDSNTYILCGLALEHRNKFNMRRWFRQRDWGSTCFIKKIEDIEDTIENFNNNLNK